MDYDRLYAMDGYCSTTGCLRNYILNYFGETADETCGRCGNCESGKGKVDITDEAVLIFRTVRSLKERYGAGVVAVDNCVEIILNGHDLYCLGIRFL